MARQTVPAAGPVTLAPWHKPSTPEDEQNRHRGGDNGNDSGSGGDLFRFSYGGDMVPQQGVPSAADLLADPTFDPGPELAMPVRRALDIEPANDADGPVADIPTVLTKLKKWGTYTSVATGPCATSKFIAMKTPLSHEVLEGWNLDSAPEHPWTVQQLLAGQAAAGRRVGMILDLSNHETLYADEIPAVLAYRHVQLVAKELPSREAVREVIDVADAFWADHPDEFIAIHCAYGFNRTGFVVCSYLCEAKGFCVGAALAAFAAVRPPGVKHEKFIAELYDRYGCDEGKSLPLLPSVAEQPAYVPTAAQLGRANSADAAAAASCASPLAPLASSMRKTKDWLLRAHSPHKQQQPSPPIAVAGPRFRGTEGFDGEDNESLGGASGTGGSALNRARVSGGRLTHVSPREPSDAGSMRAADLDGFDVGGRDSVRWDGWGDLTRVTPAPLSAVSERLSEDGSVSGRAGGPRPGSSGGLSLTAQAVALQDAVNAGEASIVPTSSPTSPTVIVHVGSRAGSHADSGADCAAASSAPGRLDLHSGSRKEELQGASGRLQSQQKSVAPQKFCKLM